MAERYIWADEQARDRGTRDDRTRYEYVEYVGIRGQNRACEIRVVRWSGDAVLEYPLRHIRRHSEDFEWGYGGSGPADTALSILTDAVGAELAERLYQEFKWQIVAYLPVDPPYGIQWRLSRGNVELWVKDMMHLHSGEGEGAGSGKREERSGGRNALS